MATRPPTARALAFYAEQRDRILWVRAAQRAPRVIATGSGHLLAYDAKGNLLARIAIWRIAGISDNPTTIWSSAVYGPKII